MRNEKLINQLAISIQNNWFAIKDAEKNRNFIAVRVLSRERDAMINLWDNIVPIENMGVWVRYEQAKAV